MSFIKLQERIISSKPLSRKLLLALIDGILLPVCILFVVWIKNYDPINIESNNSLYLLLLSSFLGLLIYFFTGQYKSITRYVGSSAFYNIFARNIFLIFILSGICFMFQFPQQPFSFWFLLIIFFTASTSFYRYIIRDLLLKFRTSKNQSIVAIYGAGAAGAQLANTLRMNGRHDVAFFIDDDDLLWGRTINNISVLHPKYIESLKTQVDEVFLAIPSISKSRRAEIIQFLQKKGLKVKQVPSINDLTSGKSKIDSLRPIAIEDLLCRDPVDPDPELLSGKIPGSVILVTGAGGSIGSELCRQIIKFKPSKLILFERSEISLYQINQELKIPINDCISILPVLGCATNLKFLDKTIRENNVDFIFHAAAYKHVPLLEENALQGIYNNVFSTQSICIAAEKNNTRGVILISSDKAVRPANIMGASKRLSELVVQAYSQKNQERGYFNTCFSMVRFGNVLGSSGSVVPLFNKQIELGGPITITDPNVIRYFMTITEAAQLVLQASSLSKGGDVFLLDMGQPVKIMQLAEKMVSLNYLTIKDKKNCGGDIEIISTGLRPGEKLFEELLIDSASEKTVHPLIFKAKEKFIPYEILFPKLKHLEQHLLNFDTDKSLDLLNDLVEEWKR